MVLEHLVDELVTFFNDKQMAKSSPSETEDGGEPRVQELFDEPEFA